MSWESKTDYCGLASGGTLLVVKSSNPNRSSQYLEKLGQDGAIAATKLYGDENASPSVEYAIKSAGNLTVEIGKVTTVDGERFALQSVVYKKTAGGEPTLTATSVRIEDSTDGADQKFAAVTLAISPEETADFCINAATVTGTNCEVTDVTTTVSGTVNPHLVNGDPVASGVHSGKIEMDITIGQYGTAAPTVSAASGSGFEISQALNGDDPDSDMPSWTVKLTKPLDKQTSSSSSGGGTGGGSGT